MQLKPYNITLVIVTVYHSNRDYQSMNKQTSGEAGARFPGDTADDTFYYQRSSSN